MKKIFTILLVFSVCGLYAQTVTNQSEWNALGPDPVSGDDPLIGLNVIVAEGATINVNALTLDMSTTLTNNGTISCAGGGVIINTSMFTNNGSFSIVGGFPILVGSSWVNNGDVTLGDAPIEAVGGPFTNTADGTLTMGNGPIIAGADITVTLDGTVDKGAGPFIGPGTILINNTMTTTGLTLLGGVKIHNTSTITVAGGGFLESETTLTNSGAITAEGGLEHQGAIVNTGTIDFLGAITGPGTVDGCGVTDRDGMIYIPDVPSPPGTACDDGNPNTINDVYDENCVCEGELEVVPTMGEWGVMSLLLIMMIFGVVAVRSRQTTLV